MWQNRGGVLAVLLFVSFSFSISKCRNLEVLNIFFKWVNILIVVYKCVTQKCQLERWQAILSWPTSIKSNRLFPCPLPLFILVPLSVYIRCITHGSDCEADSYMQNSPRRNPTVGPTSPPTRSGRVVLWNGLLLPASRLSLPRLHLMWSERVAPAGSRWACCGSLHLERSHVFTMLAVQQISRRGTAEEGAVWWELSHTGSKPYRTQGFDANRM